MTQSSNVSFESFLFSAFYKQRLTNEDCRFNYKPNKFIRTYKKSSSTYAGNWLFHFLKQIKSGCVEHFNIFFVVDIRHISVIMIEISLIVSVRV